MSDASPGPLALYRTELARCGFSIDPDQARVASRLEDLYQRLLDSDRPRSTGLLTLFRRSATEPETGLYIWGDTGRGKTWLVDLFYETLPFTDKLRRHFHRFMADVHEQMAELEDHADPLDTVAAQIAETARVVCFDEFFVSDIADAMILGTLLASLFRRGVTVVATSNIPPQNLYKDGLQHSRFQTAIDLIQRYTETVHMDGANDYRLRALEKAEIYHSPLDNAARQSLTRSFEQIAPDVSWRQDELMVSGRMIHTFRRAEGVVWFTFEAICDGPRSQLDYIEIARSFHSVLVSEVPCFDETTENQARRFIALVDEFYDRNVKLIVSAAVPIDQLYAGQHLDFEFRRTRSRLEEMQSHDYLARPHLP
ncbi:MAG: cell division protein ZapE [Gammaproteobacteria bacterium]